jgi:Leucine-rich repeat (LRR) protein
MEDYTSDSSDSDNVQRTLDYSYQMLDQNTVYHNIEHFVSNDKKHSECVDTLLLYHNMIKVLPLNLNKFKNLKLLDISSNGLVQLPEILTECPLTSLIAKNNNLDNGSFPKSFGALVNLKELNVSGNNLTCLPEQILEVTSVKYLYLGGNRITELSKDIWKLNG